MNKYCYFLASVMLFQGCTSISQPTASRPLVEHEYVIAAPAESDLMQRQLSRNESGSKISVNKESGTIGAQFFAATGATCRKVYFTTSGQTVFCRNELKQWYRVKSVISVYAENSRGGAQ
tara:strand:+ start:29182 stop:29541 length:360 start_codon:yes stop_codon:yes gene_type:complete